MTGFGKSELKNEKFELSVEVRSVNNRYLDIGLRLPKNLYNYEYLVKELIKKNVYRGKLTLSVNFKDSVFENMNLKLNEGAVSYYHNLLVQLKDRLSIDGDITLDHILYFKELFEPEETDTDDEELVAALKKVITAALKNFNEMRDQEAKNLAPEIIETIDLINSHLAEIRERGKATARTELERLRQRVADLIVNADPDSNRLETELALIADRVDITEECARLQSHLDLFRDVFTSKDQVGKQLTFILQEMHRETNTIGSKTTDVNISHRVIAIKEEIEKIREQAQNLE